MPSGAKFSTLFVEGFRFACAAERITDEMLTKLGFRRRFFSQKGQDRWIVERALPGRENGYFVEIGAGDGRTHSNTYALERDHGWSGLLIEPNPDYARAIEKLRSSRLIRSGVDRQAGDHAFLALGYIGGLIGDDTDYAPSRRGSVLRRHSDKIMSIPCQRLDTILETAAAPRVIDYLSIDVEGAELRILENFPFHSFTFRALTVERPTRAVHMLLTDAGYVLDRLHLSDGFYLSADLAADLGVEPRPFAGTPRKFF